MSTKAYKAAGFLFLLLLAVIVGLERPRSEAHEVVDLTVGEMAQPAVASGRANAGAPPPDRTWQEVGAGSASGGGISDNDGESGWPALAIAADGTVYVTWYDESSGDREIYVKQWRGGAWEEVGPGSASGGGISGNRGSSTAPAIAVGADGFPYVAWRDWSSGRSQIYVRQWNGRGWQEVGAGSASGGGISRTNATSEGWPAIAVGADGRPVVAWEDNSFGWDQIFVKRWNGEEWAPLGSNSARLLGISRTLENSRRPHVAAAPDGTVYVAWADSISGNAEIFVRRWNGASWTEVGANAAHGSGISATAGESQSPSIAVAADGTPFVAWTDNDSGRYEVYVRRWNGREWQEVGSGSAGGGGISRSSGDSLKSHLAIDAGGTPYVMWYDLSAGDAEIYVRYWDGANWVEAGPGSASGGGISDNSANSTVGSLAIASNGDPTVAWGDGSGGNYEIYVKRWSE